MTSGEEKEQEKEMHSVPNVFKHALVSVDNGISVAKAVMQLHLHLVRFEAPFAFRLLHLRYLLKSFNCFLDPTIFIFILKQACKYIKSRAKKVQLLYMEISIDLEVV